MVVVILALLAVAVTAAVVIRDAHPRVAHPSGETPASTPEQIPAPEPIEAPTEAIDMTQLVLPDSPPGEEDSVDAPTQSVPMPVSFGGAQAAAILPYPTSIVEPAGFTPAGKPQLQPNPDRLIQTEIVIEDGDRAHTLALTRLAIGMAASGAVIGLGVIGIARGITLLVHTLAG